MKKLTAIFLSFILVILFVTSASAESDRQVDNNTKYHILRGPEETYTITEYRPAFIDQSIKISVQAETVYDPTIILAPEEPEITDEIISISKLIPNDDRISYPIDISEPFYYNFYNVQGQIISTASVTVNGVYYGTGNGDIVSISASFGGSYGSLFSAYYFTVGNKATLYIYYNGSHLDTKRYTMIADDISD